MWFGKWAVVIDGVPVPGEEMYENPYDSQLRCDHLNNEVRLRTEELTRGST